MLDVRGTKSKIRFKLLHYTVIELFVFELDT